MDQDATPPASLFTTFHRRLMEGIAGPLVSEHVRGWAATLVKTWAAQIARNGTDWQARHERYYRDQLELWQRVIGAVKDGGAAVAPRLPDRRFQHSEWQLPYFAYLAESYLLAQRWLEELIANMPLEVRAKQKAAFLARQYVDAMSPSNFPWSNPQALRRAQESGGKSWAAGLKNLRSDLDLGRVSNVDRSAFKVGANLAMTPGAVVYENDLIQLIQYTAGTRSVYERPLVIVPPCINKYYILDLKPGNSLVRYAVSRGHTVFMISWRNVPPALGTLTWDDYLAEGVTKALDVARDICGIERVNALGFCVGGTLLASALAVEAARGRQPAQSLTLLASMLDFSDTGELGLFIDEESVSQRERELGAGGILRGEELALAFASLRANDLIWRYVVNNYLLGQSPEAFDLLFWNSDSADLPGPMYVYYLRNMYLENNLRTPGKLQMCGVSVDLGRLDLPAFVMAAREDHIVPWRTAYASAALLRGKIEFILTASGHIAGVVNPPPTKRRRYWTGGETRGAEPDRWLANATCRIGSWWPCWSRWLAQQGGARVAQRPLGTARFPQIEPAPGRFVTERSKESGVGNPAQPVE